MSRRPSQRTALLALAAFAASAATAQAAPTPYEQLSRASGAAGLSAIDRPSGVGVTSDLGFAGIYAQFSPGQGFFPDVQSYLRNTLTNQTRPVGPAGQVIAIDRRERTILTENLGSPATTFSIGSTQSTTGTLVASLPAAGLSNATLSGNGRTVLYSSNGLGTTTYDVATKTTKQVSAEFIGVGRNSISDDGRVIAGSSYDDESGAIAGSILIGGKLTHVAGTAVVSPDGSTVAYIDPAAGANGTLVTRSVSTGRERRSPVPATITPSPKILWIAAGGGRIAIGPDTDYGSAEGPPPAPKPAQALTTATGRWAIFGGAFATSLNGFTTAYSISRSGHFATLTYNDQVALVGLDGAILGGDDALSASSYLGGDKIYSFGCGIYAGFNGYLAQPARWVAPPRKASVTVSVDGVVVTQTDSTTPAQLPDPSDAPDPAFATSFPAGAQQATVTYKVIDAQGRKLSETFTKKLSCD